MPSREKYLDDYFIDALNIANNYYPSIAATSLYKLYEKYADELIRGGFLKQAAYLQDIFVVVNGRAVSKEIEIVNGVTCYFSKNTMKEVSEFQLRMYTCNFNWLLKNILYGLGASAEHRYNCILDEFIWSFGNIYLKQHKVSIIVVRCIMDKEIYRVLVQYLNNYHIKTPALVLAIEEDIPEYFSLPGNNVCLNIKNILLNDVDKLYFNIDLILEKMSKDIQKEGFSDGYRSAHIKSKFYTFSKKQAEALELMDKLAKPMHQDEIMAAISPNSKNNKLFFLFRSKKGMHPAWSVIIKTDGQGSYWLEY